MRYLVFGADGREGRAVVEGLLRRGVACDAVAAAARHLRSEAAHALGDLGVAVVRAHAGSPASVAAALERVGAERVFFSTDYFARGSGTVDRARARGAAVVEACEQSPTVDYVVYGSSCDCDRAPRRVAHFRADRAVERRLEKRLLGDVDVAVVRKAALLDDLEVVPDAAGRPRYLRYVTKAETAVQWTSLLDFGKAAAAALENRDRFAGLTLDVATCEHAGPELAKLLGAVLGAPVAYAEMMPRIEMKLHHPEIFFMTKFLETLGGSPRAESNLQPDFNLSELTAASSQPFSPPAPRRYLLGARLPADDDGSFPSFDSRSSSRPSTARRDAPSRPSTAPGLISPVVSPVAPRRSIGAKLQLPRNSTYNKIERFARGDADELGRRAPSRRRVAIGALATLDALPDE
ncbi:reduced folate carrier [Aureococcus anophagefferens]|uniref:Reduced folate carrier n=1 Tax=Aureococcus anophagefferens TaxID=44056 RepID=A0ABR1G5B5_AURAN